MSSLIRTFSLRLILILAGLAVLPFSVPSAALADDLQSIAESATQYAANIYGQYGNGADLAAAAGYVADGKKSSTNLHILMNWVKQGSDWKLLSRASTKL